MRHLKNFSEINERQSSLGEIANECEDILSYIRDDGMHVVVDYDQKRIQAGYRGNQSVGTEQEITVAINKIKNKQLHRTRQIINLSDNKESVEHLINYLRSEGFRLSLCQYEYDDDDDHSKIREIYEEGEIMRAVTSGIYWIDFTFLR